MTEKQAWLNLIETILKENGYYENLRGFYHQAGYNITDFATQIYLYWDDAPDGMSIYYFMDSLEDMLNDADWSELSDVSDMVDYVYDHELWKE